MTLGHRRIRNISIALVVALALVGIDVMSDVALYQSVFLSGWLLFISIVLLLAYRVRKALTMLPIGAASTWLQIHIYTGLIAIVIFLIHAGTTLPVGILEFALYVLFVAVAMSGVIGLILARVLPQRLTARGEEVIWERIPIFIAELRREAEGVVFSSIDDTKSSTLRDFYIEHLHDFFSRPKHGLYHLIASNRPVFALSAELDNFDRYLNEQEKIYARDLRALVHKKDDLDFHYALMGTLKIWLLVHAPLSFGIIVLAILHMVLVHAFGGGM